MNLNPFQMDSDSAIGIGNIIMNVKCIYLYHYYINTMDINLRIHKIHSHIHLFTFTIYHFVIVTMFEIEQEKKNFFNMKSSFLPHEVHEMCIALKHIIVW